MHIHRLMTRRTSWLSLIACCIALVAAIGMMKTTWGSKEHADHVILLAGFTGPVALYSDVPTVPPLPVNEAAGVRRIVVNPRGCVITSSD